jgi:hypothetical protein
MLGNFTSNVHGGIRPSNMHFGKRPKLSDDAATGVEGQQWREIIMWLYRGRVHPLAPARRSAEATVPTGF